MALTLPSGKPSPYAPKPVQPVNPWGSQHDPSKPVQGQYSGSQDQAKAGLNYAAQKGWGRSLTPEEEQSIYGNAQKQGYKGGNVDTNTYNNSLSYMQQLLGPQAEKPKAPTPGEPAPGLGAENATAQWSKQALAAGVPQSYRGANPYADQQQAMMSKILANPETMGQQFQDQLGESQKESANRMLKQGQNAASQQQANRGFSTGGGQEHAMRGQQQQDMISNLLSGRRDIATQATQQNRQDQYNALNASQGLNDAEWNGQMQLAGLGLNQMNQNRGANLNDFLGAHSADMDVMNWEQNNDQFNKNFGLDFLRWGTQKDQFNATLGENQRQFNGNMGFNWASLSAQQQQQLMAQMFGAR